ncbi:MAG: tetratricopeptide repeat protein [Bacteroidales bacterium]
MKYILLSLVLSILHFATLAKAEPDSLLNAANEHYTNGDFEKAAKTYQTLVDSGYHNADLYYNLGNAYFKQNNIPYAILNYERAYQLKPNDEDIEYNLEYARTFTVDRIEPIPVFFLTKWYRSVRGLLSSNAWAWVSLFWLAIGFSLALVFWFSSRPWLKRLCFAMAIFAFVLTAMSGIFSAQEKQRMQLRNHAIIFQPVVTVKSSPGEAGQEIFILHSGTKVKITKTIGEWVEIKIADGNKGWIPSGTIELI